MLSVDSSNLAGDLLTLDDDSFLSPPPRLCLGWSVSPNDIELDLELFFDPWLVTSSSDDCSV